MKSKINRTLSVIALSSLVLFTACIKDLDTIPVDPDVLTSEKIYKEFANYKLVLAKCYAGLAVSGQKGPDGDNDLSGLDEGFGQYIRAYWYAQELPTDEAVIGWNDGSLRDYQEMDWSAANEFINNMYSRIFYQIALCNEYIGQTAASKVSGYGFTQAQNDEIEGYRAEARFLRALSYYHAIDMFGSVPFVTEESGVGTYLPPQISRKDLFTYIETELKDIETVLPLPKANEYGRVDRASAWMLLARLYLNAEVYGAGAKYTEAITYCNKVITEGGYALEDTYQNMFLADNHTADGIIFAIPYDGIKTQTWGGTTFIINAQVGGSMLPANFGISGSWWGLRTRPEFYEKFADDLDTRKMFYTAGQQEDITDMFDFTKGFAVTKWKNLTSAGVAGSNGTHTDTDFPVFRLADAYLMYAEAVLRGGTGGSASTALDYVNEIREKAYGGVTGDITSTDLTLSFILDERGRELYWEGYRRTDLIRYGLLTGGGYIWQWKGGTHDGAATASKYNLFPIPDSDISANPNLVQNTGY